MISPILFLKAMVQTQHCGAPVKKGPMARRVTDACVTDAQDKQK